MTGQPTVRLNYVELSVAATAPARDFYAAALGWTFSDFGPTYSATTTDDTDLGLDADRKLPPLPVFESSDVAASREAVLAAGGTLVRDIYEFPGGRRFEFTDPDGNEVAVWQRG
ncbi:VOC family protein [Novosphingopyxis iocasae]|uniref:VOC family protein n=1 Tax=Novosphingopyxis iocasae TaxID=2762729 RepID=UPI00165147AC|nr:VOC family protein [Novosphingopyxis iocasae]